MATLIINFVTIVFFLVTAVYFLFFQKLDFKTGMTTIQGIAVAYIVAQQWVSQEKTRRQESRKPYLECYNHLKNASVLVARHGINPEVSTNNPKMPEEFEHLGLRSEAFQHYSEALNIARLFLKKDVLRYVESIYEKASETLGMDGVIRSMQKPQNERISANDQQDQKKYQDYREKFEKNISFLNDKTVELHVFFRKHLVEEGGWDILKEGMGTLNEILKKNLPTAISWCKCKWPKKYRFGHSSSEN